MSKRTRTAAPTVPPEGAHDWVSFPDPDEDRTWLVDVTFLLSHWRCIFADGCQGVLTGPVPELVQGCCSYGAHFVDDEDVARVKKAALSLTSDDWQFQKKYRKGNRVDVVKRGKDGTMVTRLYEGACVFLNRPGFAGGPGCALHAAALRHGKRPMDLKPSVCWQLPLRREDEVDSTGHVTSTVGEWDRRHWGEGGFEFHWWCTEAPEAFTGADPVYVSMADELEELVGPDVYPLLVAELERRRTARPAALPHPAEAPVTLGKTRRR
ncbi:MAG TPA: hypothetical protein VMU14_08565 [Acidimicrobiales bacterium]|nr:hypothetical protein [Acidimicrobiales bacterium]